MTSILPNITLETGPHPDYSIIWLHGLGADGEDFVPIADEMRLPAPVRYIFPHAPVRPVTINGGYSMRAWYDIYTAASSTDIAANLTVQEDEAGIRASQREIEKLIEQEKSLGIPEQRIFLAGFSQGGAIALQTGLRMQNSLAGILALSTYLPLASAIASEATPEGKATPIFMAHGKLDPVVPMTLGKRSEHILVEQGCNTDWREYHMPHSVYPEEIQDIEQWLSDLMAR